MRQQRQARVASDELVLERYPVNLALMSRALRAGCQLPRSLTTP